MHRRDLALEVRPASSRVSTFTWRKPELPAASSHIAKQGRIERCVDAGRNDGPCNVVLCFGMSPTNTFSGIFDYYYSVVIVTGESKPLLLNSVSATAGPNRAMRVGKRS